MRYGQEIITYIRTEEGWLYLAAVIDIYSREVIGWQLDNRMGIRFSRESIKERVTGSKN